LENMPTVTPKLVGDRFTYGNDPARIAAMVREIGHPALTCCLDVSHAAIAAATRGSDLASDIRAMAPDIGHLHLHDSFGLPPELFTWIPEENDSFGQGDLHLPLGWGNLDFAALLTGLAVRPDPILTLEIMPRHQRPDTLADCLARARQIAATLTPTPASVT
ncbi:MAG: sugar phosphate isomerase/epimerase family protein, partial [Rhodospirillaceae bacterium]